MTVLLSDIRTQDLPNSADFSTAMLQNAPTLNVRQLYLTMNRQGWVKESSEQQVWGKAVAMVVPGGTEWKTRKSSLMKTDVKSEMYVKSLEREDVCRQPNTHIGHYVPPV